MRNCLLSIQAYTFVKEKYLPETVIAITDQGHFIILMDALI
jgi:hypothetical protein